MTMAQPAEADGVTAEVLDLVPELRQDFVRRDIEGECVVWSPLGKNSAAKYSAVNE